MNGINKQVYIKPVIEVDEYISEKGFASSYTPEEYDYFTGDVSNESVDKGDEYGFHYSFEDL